MVKETTPKSDTGKAIAYMLNRWRELTAFPEDVCIELSNNIIENRIRPLALGRKKWMFAGSEEGARKIAVVYTFLGTALLNNINPFDALSKVLEVIPSRNASDIVDLLPINGNSFSF
jgi:hypothetical protein